jgi:SAM-dependent methyltransferase
MAGIRRELRDATIVCADDGDASNGERQIPTRICQYSAEDAFMANLKSCLRKPIRDFPYLSSVKKFIESIPGGIGIYPAVQRTHPFDKQYGIETSGFVAVEEIHSDKNLQPLINPYAGSQPSIVRAALAALGDIADYTFIDLGCGKGRVTTVATEFPFREIVGVELSPALAGMVRVNTAKIARQFPDRQRVTVVEANVVDFALPPGKLVFFTYHAFGPEIVAQMVARIEAALDGATPHMFFVYYNPVYFEPFDASPAFTRFYAAQIPYDKTEIGFGPDPDDAVVIWQSVRGAGPTPHPRADRKVAITKHLWKAGLAD